MSQAHLSKLDPVSISGLRFRYVGDWSRSWQRDKINKNIDDWSESTWCNIIQVQTRVLYCRGAPPMGYIYMGLLWHVANLKCVIVFTLMICHSQCTMESHWFFTIFESTLLCNHLPCNNFSTWIDFISFIRCWNGTWKFYWGVCSWCLSHSVHVRITIKLHL